MTSTKTTHRLMLALVFLIGASAVIGARRAQADIGHAGGHAHYGVELEPHLVLQWSQEPAWNDEGIGIGLRASIPVIQDGPVKSINNSLAVGFGLDWAHFEDNCFGPGPNPLQARDCSANDFWIPIVLQWNFYFSDLISAFPEFGLAIQHTRFDGSWCGNGNNRVFCDDFSDTDVEPVLWLGVRFHLADEFALTLRLGTPSLLFGASFFL